MKQKATTSAHVGLLPRKERAKKRAGASAPQQVQGRPTMEKEERREKEKLCWGHFYNNRECEKIIPRSTVY